MSTNQIIEIMIDFEVVSVHFWKTQIFSLTWTSSYSNIILPRPVEFFKFPASDVLRFLRSGF